MALLSDTKLTSLLIPLKDVREATNNFHEDNIISTGGFGPAYKGRLLLRSGKWIKIAARRLDPRYRPGELEFLTEVTVLSDLNHPNVVSMIGYCDEEGEKIIVTPYAAKGSLGGIIHRPRLTWNRRLKICLGVARALSYLHFDEGRDYGVIHCNINSDTILLDENWEPKLSGFEICFKQPLNRMDRVIPCETLGMEEYMDPENEKTRGVTYKSDIYSFGVVLFEILCGRLAFIEEEEEANSLLVPWVRSEYKNGTVENVINTHLLNRTSMQSQSVQKFFKIAIDCIEEERTRRPDMDKVVFELEKALEFQLPFENFGLNSKLLKIPLADIKLATEDFSERYKIGRTKYFTWYRVGLNHFNKENPSSVEVRNNNVIIRRIDSHIDREEVFFREAKMLSVEHCNIVKLLGFCLEGWEMILVMENPPNGYLADCLQNVNKKRILTWEKRLKICIDVSHALNYLHSKMEEQKKVIHYDISSETIALDENWEAKIVEFGPREYVIPNQIIKTDYVDIVDGPDLECSKLRELDVYHFGMVLFGILFGKPTYNSHLFHESQESLAWDARACDPRNRFRKVTTLEEMIDPIIKEEMGQHSFAQNRGLNKASLNTFIKIAYLCLEETEDRRPTMKVVVKELKKALSYQDERGKHQDMNLDFDEFKKGLVLNLMHEVSEHGQPPDMYLEDVNEFKEAEELKAKFKINEEQGQHSDRDIDAYEFMKAEELKAKHEIFLQEMNLEHSKISLADIQSATKDFNWEYMNGHSNYCAFFTAELHFDKDSLTVDERNKDQVPQRHVTVFIKRVIPRVRLFFDDEGGVFDVDKIGQFYTEVKMLTSVKHCNIASLLGFCDEGAEMILVMEDLSNGILKNYLSDDGKMRALTWEKRLRICVDVAHALNYLHSEMEDQKMIINRSISSINIGLDKNLGAKIVDFRLSLFLPPNQEDEALNLEISDIDREYEYKKTGKLKRKSDAYIHNISDGAPYYIDPEYKKTGKLKRESDVYSFGVVLFEILCGRTADDPNYLEKNNKGLAFLARQCSNMGTLEEMIDPLIKEETGEYTFILNKGPNKDSLATFIEIANKCVSETQDQRPTMEVVVRELEKALSLQINKKNNPVISLEDVKLATGDFDPKNYIGGGGFGEVYKGKLRNGDELKTIVVKRLNDKGKQFTPLFLRELQISLEYKHENVIGLVGYCDEKDEKILVYEYASRSSLDGYLKHSSLTWLKRLNICIGVASALDFFHGGIGKQAKVVHRDIKTANILLNHDWEAKLADFGLSLISSITKETDYVIDGVCGTEGYMDPLYKKSKFLTIESDIYSFGVVLFEILCGISTHTILKREGHYLPDFIKRKFEEGKREEVVFEQIRKEIVPESLTTFQDIAYRCLNIERGERPNTKEVLVQLKRALEFQISKKT